MRSYPPNKYEDTNPERNLLKIINLDITIKMKTYKKIKNTVSIFLFFFVLLQPACPQSSELKQPVSINLLQKPLSDVFALITQQTGVRFSYNSQQINVNRKISVHVKNRELGKVLPLILPASVSYKQVGKYIILSVSGTAKKAAYSNKSALANIQNHPENSLLAENNPNSIHLIDKTEEIFSLKNSFFSSGLTLDSCHRVISPINEEEMKKKLALLALSATIAGNQLSAQTETATQETPETPKTEEVKTLTGTTINEKRSSQVTFVYPLGTDGKNSIYNEYNTSFNIIGGITGKVTGFELGGIFNINKHGSKGVQIAGIMNHTEAAGSGATSKNVQISGIYNFSKNGVSTQIGGIVNLTKKSPAQIAGTINIADTANAQISGIINMANTSSFQLSTVNITRKGCFQLGVVNVRDTADGISIGIINIVKKGGLMEVEIGGSDITQATLSFRSGTQKLYGILSAGYNSSDEFLSTGFGLGTEITLKNRWRLNLEGIHYGLYNGDPLDNRFVDNDWKDRENWEDSLDEYFEDYNFASLTQLRATINFKVAKHFKIYAGPTLNISVVDKDFKFTAPYSIWSASGDHVNVKTWVGCTAGIRL